MPTAKAGLEDVVAASSGICDIIGSQGRLTYRGIDIHDLARHSTFEEVTFLLWFGRLPSGPELRQFGEELAARRTLPPEVLRLLREFPAAAPPMDVLRTAVSALSLYEPPLANGDAAANLEKARRVTAQMATLVAAIDQIRHGRQPVPPPSGGSHAESFLFMLFGRAPEPLAVSSMDLALILHADHELNASTFAARVTAATLADLYAAVVAALGALSGPLHGGANEQVMRMLQAIGRPERAEAHVGEALAAHKKVPGFGHRVYRTEDPRATHLREAARELGQRAGDPRWYDIARRVEAAVLKQRQLYPNVDFYSAPSYFAMGIPIDMFTPVFAVSRVSGWTAHVLEQYADNRLIRPRAEYVGHREVPYVPIERRSAATA
jgi:citrate synthase